MCSLNDYNCNSSDGGVSENANISFRDAALCRKCMQNNIDVLLISQNGYCKTCFLIATNHKFRAALGKSKIIRQGDLIMVDYTGELNSTVLLHLIKTSKNESAHKKLIFETIVLYIDDGAIIGRTVENRIILRYNIAKQLKDFGFNSYFVSLSQVLSKEDALDIKPIDCQLINNENDKKLREILNSLPDDTSRIDLLDHLRQKLLLSVARKLNCNKIFVTDSTMNIATKVLGNICLGRGAQLSKDAVFSDILCTDIKILKPIRDFTQQELIYYSECHQLNLIQSDMINRAAHLTSSIQMLAHNFTVKLDSQFPGTVPTIFRTAEKLSARNSKDNQSKEESCLLCNTQLNSTLSNDRESVMRAIEISRLMSSKYVDAISLNKKKENRQSNCDQIAEIDTSLQSNDQKCCNQYYVNNDCKSCCKNNRQKEHISSEDIKKYLCYSCKLIFQNTDILCVLPASLLSMAQQRSTFKNMKDKINDFLL